MSPLYYRIVDRDGRSVSAIYSEAHANLVARSVRGQVIAVHENRAHGVPTTPGAKIDGRRKQPPCLPFATAGSETASVI